MDHGGGEDLVEGVGVAELGVGVFGGVEVVDAGDFGEVGWGGAVSGNGKSVVSWVGTVSSRWYFGGETGEKGELTSPYTPSLHFQTFVPRPVHW